MRRVLLLIICCFFLLSESIYANVEEDVIDLVNAERAAGGLHPLNSFPPTADAGPSQNVLEGETIMLDGSLSSDANDAVVAHEWTQISGPDMVLSDENAAKPTFQAAPILEDATLVFELTVFDSGGSSDSATVEILIAENGDIDPSEPGVDPSNSGETGSSGGSGGCFIDTAGFDSNLQNYLRRFRNFILEKHVIPPAAKRRAGIQ